MRPMRRAVAGRPGWFYIRDERGRRYVHRDGLEVARDEQARTWSVEWYGDRVGAPVVQLGWALDMAEEALAAAGGAA